MVRKEKDSSVKMTAEDALVMAVFSHAMPDIPSRRVYPNARNKYIISLSLLRCLRHLSNEIEVKDEEHTKRRRNYVTRSPDIKMSIFDPVNYARLKKAHNKSEISTTTLPTKAKMISAQ